MQALAFVCGAVWVTLQSSLPSVVGIVSGFALACIVRPRWWRLFAISAIGSVAVVVAAENRLANRWPLEQWYVEHAVDGIVTSFVSGDTARIAFLFRGDIAGVGQRLIHVHWYRPPAQQPRLGETWRLMIRLRAPRGTVNPGGFDVERYSLAKSIDATGYVVSAAPNIRLAVPAPFSVLAWRQRVATRIAASMDSRDHVGLLIALALGSRHAITPSLRDLTAVTGTAHLLAVSGLHVGLAAAAGAALGRVTTVPALLFRHTAPRLLIALAALLSATLYALAAGFALPTRRALVMLAIGLLAWLVRRPLAASNTLSVALVSVMLVWPLSVLSVSLYLSFAMVALLLVSNWRARIRASGRRRFPVVGAQLLLSVAALPLGLGVFGTVPWLGIAANLVMIPVVSLVIVPALLVVLVIPPLGSWILPLLDQLLAVLLTVLQLIGAGTQSIELPTHVGLLATVAVLVWLPAHRTLRLTALLAALAVFNGGRSLSVDRGCAHIAVIDVGQGQAVLVKTRYTATLIDTGASWPSGSVAASTIAPLLRRQGITRLDRLIVSHSDNDHAGGAAYIAQHFRPTTVVSGEPLPANVASEACRPGQRWSDGAVTVRIVGPYGKPLSGNDASCVVQIVAGAHRVLVPGDIEARGERALLASAQGLASDVVVMPHHGSNSSSTEAFVAAVVPRYAIASSGYKNRWRFPAAAVTRRWQAYGARVLTTGSRGHIGIDICTDGLRIDGGERQRQRRWWRHRAE
ncbi:MAG: DNA internalization-related competence protein ComEC/Rec2 [Pseudomonadota bacterium]